MAPKPSVPRERKSSGKSPVSAQSSLSPPKPTAKCERMNIILDIDETLLYFINGKVRGHSWDKLSAVEQAKYEYTVKGQHVLILRPHVRKFLSFLFRNFNVSLWTLSEREYAEDIASVLLSQLKTKKPNRNYKFAHVFSADDDEDHDVAAGDLHGNNKDLNWLWYEYAKDYPCFAECNTILIDDLPANALNNSNRQNTIKIAPFALFGEVKARTDPYEDVSRDDVLLQIIEILKKVRETQKNCYNDDDARWKSVFHASNVKKMGLQKYYLPNQWKGDKFNSMSVKSTKAVAHVAPAAHGGTINGGVYVVYNVDHNSVYNAGHLERVHWTVNVFQTFEYNDERERVAQLAAAESKLTSMNASYQHVTIGLIKIGADDRLKIKPWVERPPPENRREVWKVAFTDYANSYHKKKYVYAAVKNPGQGQYQLARREVESEGGKKVRKQRKSKRV